MPTEERDTHRPTPTKGAGGQRRLDWLRPKQAFALLSAARDIHQRFGALLTFLLYSGVRLSEALRLERRDVDLDLAQALVRNTKTVHLPPPIIAALSGLDRQRARAKQANRLADCLCLLP